MSDAEARRQAVIVVSWLLGLHEEKPRDASEQWPMAWMAARRFLEAAVPANDA